MFLIMLIIPLHHNPPPSTVPLHHETQTKFEASSNPLGARVCASVSSSQRRAP